MRPFRELAEPIADLLGPMPYNVMQTLLDPLWAKGIQAYFKAANVRELDDALIDNLVALHAQAARGRRPRSTSIRWAARSRACPRTRPAFPERSMPFVVNCVTGWHDAVGSPTRTSTWARAVIDVGDAESSTGRAYVNFLGDPTAAESAYGPRSTSAWWH